MIGLQSDNLRIQNHFSPTRQRIKIFILSIAEFEAIQCHANLSAHKLAKSVNPFHGINLKSH